MSRLVLGTAQWGSSYGIANRVGRLRHTAVSAIAQEAWNGGIRTLDTAQAYAAAEDRIGRLTAQPWEIVTKLPPDLAKAEDVPLAIERSLTRLQRSCLDVLMLHRPAHRRIPGVWDRLIEARERGTVRQLGVSVVSVDQAAEEASAVDAIQVPASLFDQRLLQAGFFRRPRPRVFVRSVLLQGVATLSPDRLPPCAKPLAGSITRLQDVAKDLESSVSGLLLRYARDRFGTEIVVGTETVQQLRENLAAWRGPALGDDVMQALEEQIDPETQEEGVLNPARWGI